jgi:hypothetical protein
VLFICRKEKDGGSNRTNNAITGLQIANEFTFVNETTQTIQTVQAFSQELYDCGEFL